jgi:hypothetical protein
MAVDWRNKDREADHEAVFSHLNQFMEHHSDSGLAESFRNALLERGPGA